MYNVSGGNLAIGISLLMRDGFSGPAAMATASMSRMDRQMHSLAKSQLTMARNSNLLGAAIGIGVISKMASWVREGAKFGYTMQYVSSLTGGTVKQMDKLDIRAKNLGQSTMFSSQEVVSGMRFMAMAGMNTLQIYDNIGAAVNLSIATMTSLGGKGGGADILTNIMKGFSIESQHAARVADILTTATTSANISLTDMGETMKYAAATAMDLNVGLEEVSVMAMMAGNAGIQGTMAGTAIENMLRYITGAAGKDRKKAVKYLGMLGLAPDDLKDARGNLKSIGSLMHLIANQASKLTDGGTKENAEAQNIYKTLFGVRGKREASIMLRNMQDYDTFLSKLNNNSSGKALEVAGGQMVTLEGRMKQWTDTLANLKIAYAESVEPVLKPFIWGLSKLVQVLNLLMKTKMGSWLTIMASGWVIVKTATLAYRAIIMSIQLVTGQFGLSTVSNTTRATAGWNSATSAAARYRAVTASMGFGGGGMGAAGGFGGGVGGVSRAGRMYRGANGKFINRDTYHQARYGKYAKYTTRMPKGMGSMGTRIPSMRGGFGLGMAASLGLGMASNAVGTDSGGGKALSTLSDAANFGMMGGTIGSLFGPVGTAVGAVVGAAGGALWNVYNQLQGVEETIKGVDTDKAIFSEAAWKERAEMFMNMKEGEVRTGFAYQNRGTSVDEILAEKPIVNEIVVNLDGYELLREQILTSIRENKAEFNLGID
jgi:TP901 family phage tail tape measure protein